MRPKGLTSLQFQMAHFNLNGLILQRPIQMAQVNMATPRLQAEEFLVILVISSCSTKETIFNSLQEARSSIFYYLFNLSILL